MERKLNEDVLIFLDLETSGLSPQLDSILEIGLVIATRGGEVVDQCSWVTKPARRSPVNPSRFEEIPLDQLKANCPPKVLEMHTESGLWEDLENTKLTLFDASNQIYEWMKMNMLDISKELFTMAGYGIDRFDRPFLRANYAALGGFDTLFHYRSLDVSNLYQAFRIAGFPLEDLTKPAVTHRAVEDCLHTLDRWNQFQDQIKKWNLPL